MDPLSIATGVLTFVGACNTLASTIQKLHHLRKAPKEVQDLGEEITALQACTDGINQLVQASSGARNDMLTRFPIGIHIESARRKIEEIRDVLESTLVDVSSKTRLRSSAWLKWQSEFQRLRQELRDIRSEIGTCISLFDAAENRHNEAQLMQIALEGRQMHDLQQKSLHAIQEALSQQLPMPTAFETKVQSNGLGWVEQVDIQKARPQPNDAPLARRRSDDLPLEKHDWLQNSTAYRSRSQSLNCGSYVMVKNSAPSSEAGASSETDLSLGNNSSGRSERQTCETGVKSARSLSVSGSTTSSQIRDHQQLICKRPCSCQCHRSSKLKSPDMLRHVTGRLLVGYAGISSITPPCNEYSCAQRQKAAVRIQYQFPDWSFVQCMFTIVSYASGAFGPEKALRMSRIRPGLDEVFIQVQSGNIRRLQQLFTQGNASPLDASDTGWTLLHYALTAGQLPTARFLKEAGADLRAESATRETAVDVAWNRILSGTLDWETERLLRDVFSDDSQLDGRQFNTLHKIILGMTKKSLAEELDMTTAYINAVDNTGNTPLAWASARGDHRSAALLLQYGAALDTTNSVNTKPIHLAAQTGNIDTIQVLVQAKANINSAVYQTEMTPLHYAAEYQNDFDHIKGLVSLGSAVDSKDYLGWTPLHWASWRGHLTSLNALLECGAEVNAKTLDGNASIMLAVANNSNECIQRLVEVGADCSVVRDSHWNILHYAAIGGTVDTLRSLRTADLSEADIENLRTKDTRQTVTEMLSARLHALEDDQIKREAWKSAWDSLLFRPGCGYISQFTRSDTDSIYVDADDKPFAQRQEG